MCGIWRIFMFWVHQGYANSDSFLSVLLMIARQCEGISVHQLLTPFFALFTFVFLLPELSLQLVGIFSLRVFITLRINLFFPQSEALNEYINIFLEDGKICKLPGNILFMNSIIQPEVSLEKVGRKILPFLFPFQLQLYQQIG